MIFSKRLIPGQDRQGEQNPGTGSGRPQKPKASAQSAFSGDRRGLGESQSEGNSFFLQTLQSLSPIDLFLLCGRLYSYPVDVVQVHKDLANLPTHGELLLLERDRPIGFCQIRRVDPVARKAMIASVYVLPIHRRKGFGRTLMERAMDRCRRRSIRHLTLNVFECNPALELYRQLGFRVCGRRATTLPDGRKTQKLFLERSL